jgi:hypothetical protein
MSENRQTNVTVHTCWKKYLMVRKEERKHHADILRVQNNAMAPSGVTSVSCELTIWDRLAPIHH